MTQSNAPQVVHDLVERFSDNLDSYKSPSYNETQVRREFVDPLFKALGWDIDNNAGYAEAYKDVVHEDAIKIKGSAKAPDYAFRIGGTRKFFVETKRPSKNIKLDPEPAFQLRRYAWSAKLPLSILTDFEEFAVYDTRIKPQKADSPSIARTFYYTFEDFLTKWDEIASLFSKEAVLKGALDRYAESKRKKRGTAEVDEEFLALIEAWREDLARNIVLRNDVDPRDLNSAVQSTIDRIIFLRICEDRGIEQYGRLRDLAGASGIYANLVKLFRQADDRYNSGLFHFTKEKHRASDPDTLTPELLIDDKVLKSIIQSIYYPGPYDFRVFPPDVLGQVYEQFLGKVIEVKPSGKRVSIEEKPEARKAGGVYYTPTYIVDYIVEHTVGALVNGKAPHEVAGRTPKDFKPAKGSHPVRVLDPACGSGSFLLGAYQFLLEWYLREYTEVGDPDEHTRGRNARIYRVSDRDYRLTIAERKRILLDHIYGVDIDPQAVEVTKLSLLLKVLEGESDQTVGQSLKLFHERALPDLGNNVKCGNSLINHSVYNPKCEEELSDGEIRAVNPFDWDREFPAAFPHPRFDAVIGNPPYDVVEKDRRKTTWPHRVLGVFARQNQALLPALGGKTNLFRFFLVQSVHLLRAQGRLGMIVPLALLADISCASTREHLLASTDRLRVDCFPQKDDWRRRVFRDAKLSTVIVTADRSSTGEPEGIDVCVYPGNSFTDPFRHAYIRLADLRLLDPANLPIPLVDQDGWNLCVKLHRHPQVKRLGDLTTFVIRRGEVNQTVFRPAITGDPTACRLLKGVEIGRYCLHERLSQGEREWLDAETIAITRRDRWPKDERRIATQRITGVDERWRVVGTIVEPPMYFADSTNSIHLLKSEADGHSLEYLLGYFNSKLCQWRFRLTSTNNNVGTNELSCLPIRTIDWELGSDVDLHEELRQLVDTLRNCQMQGVGRSNVQTQARRVADLDRRVDALVYRLFDLNDAEIRIVEADFARFGGSHRTHR